jgi:hypothetical protein
MYVWAWERMFAATADVAVQTQPLDATCNAHGGSLSCILRHTSEWRGICESTPVTGFISAPTASFYTEVPHKH